MMLQHKSLDLDLSSGNIKKKNVRLSDPELSVAQI